MRYKFICEYVGVKSKKGFRGYWVSQYTIREIKDLEDKDIYIEKYSFDNLKGFKGKGFKSGDKLTFNATVQEYASSYKLSYIRDIQKID